MKITKSQLKEIIREEIQKLTEDKMVKKATAYGFEPYEIWEHPKK